MRTVIYARYSSSLQNSRSIEDQIAICQQRADREGWPIVQVFTDAAISGAAGMGEAQRPGLNAMLDCVERGGIDQVLTESTDRIARHQGDAFAIRERLTFAGTRLFTLMDGVVDDITGTIKGLMDAKFRVDLGARVRRGQRGSVAQGRAPAGIAYGYRRVSKFDEQGEAIRGLREIDDAQAEVVRRIFASYAAGKSALAIVAALNADGIPSPRGGNWRVETIAGGSKRADGILANRLYRGEMVVGRTSKVINPTSRRTVIKPNAQDTWKSAEVPHLRIIEEDLWQAVQQQRAERAQPVRAETQRRAKYLLSGLGVCGVCGAGWIKAGAAQWYCSGHRYSRSCTNGRSITTRMYERRVLADLKENLLHPDLVAEYVREYHLAAARKAKAAEGDRARLTRQIGEAERKVQRLVAAIADGGDDFTEIRELLTKHRNDRDRLKRELASIEAIDVIALHPRLADEYRRQVEKLDEALSGDDIDTQAARNQLRALIERIEVRPAPVRGVELRVIGRLDQIVGMSMDRIVSPGDVAAERLKNIG